MKLTTKKKVCVVLLAICEIDPNLRFKEIRLLPLGFFQKRFEHHNSILAPFISQLQVFLEKQQVTFFHYFVENEKLKTIKYDLNVILLNIAWIIDKASAPLCLNLALHVAHWFLSFFL